MSGYETWNQAIVDVLFTAEQAGRPVYLDLEETTLAAIAQRAGASADSDATGQLADVVRSTLNLRAWGPDTFAHQVNETRRWRRGLRRRDSSEALKVPPCLALLALLALAAEQMGTDASFAPNAYYPRLYALLGVTGERDQARFVSSFRRHAEELWAALNEWLEALDGALGTPTAYALAFRYVGLSLSQALVRARDRSKFPSLFRQFGLAPGVQVAATDLIPLIDSWVRQDPCPVGNSLRKLWEGGAAQERIASVVALELEAWNGTTEGSEAHHSRAFDLRLLANLRSFPVSSLNLSLSAGIDGPQSATVVVESALDSKPTMDLERTPDGWMRPRALVGIDPSSLLAGLLKLRDVSSGAEVVRRPRPVVPMRLDELQSGYVEIERVQLGDDCILLVANENGLADKVSSALASMARPGYTRVDSLPGLPEGWVLFREIQIMALPPGELPTTLNPLIPIVTSQLTLAGGLRLPGRVRKFSSLQPPEIRAVTQNAEQVSVVVAPSGIESDVTPVRWDSSTAALIVPLSRTALPDGDYTVQLYEGASSNPRQQAILRLRSGSSADAYMWEQATRLAYILDSEPGWGMVSASPLYDAAEQFVEGPFSQGSRTLDGTTAGGDLWWTQEPPLSTSSIQADALIAKPESNSCVSTGAHYIELPTYYGDRKTANAQQIEGACRSCGLVKRYPARAPYRAHGSKRAAPPPIDVSLLPDVVQRPASWEPALDGLMHTGGGAVSSLERLASQVDESGLFIDTFVRSLVTLGHVQIERGMDLRPATWEITASYVAQTCDSSFVLVGYWPESIRAALGEAVEAAGGSLCSEAQRVPGPLTWRISNIEIHELTSAMATNEELLNAAVIPDAAAAMASGLAPLSRLREDLPLVPIVGARSVERFDLESSSWVKVHNVAGAGAYRLVAAFRTTYLHVSDDEYRRSIGRLGSAQLVKHLAALDRGRPLLRYDLETRSLAVAMGADLPDLYARSASLCSGLLPVPIPAQRSLVYPDVSSHVAALINELLST